jgi:uncharacterized protein YecT (DUF1311 family)
MWRMAAAICFLATCALAKDAPLYPSKDCGRDTVQMEMNECANDNAQAADDALNRIYATVMAQQTDRASKDQLKDVERAWIAYRDKECAWEVGPQEEGGSIWPMEMANCVEQKTAARLHEMKPMIECTAGVSACNPH